MSIKRKTKAYLRLLPQEPSWFGTPFKPGESYCPGVFSPMKKGNRLAAQENLTEDAHNRRQAALYKTWANKVRRRKGERIMMHKSKKKASITKRQRRRERIALEQRQVQERARQAAPDVLKMLEDVVTSPGERTADRIAAGQALMDRAYGKANQPNTNVNVDANGKLSEISTKELEQRIKDTIKRVEDLTGAGVRTAEKSKGKEGPADIRERDGNTGGSTLH